MKMLEDRIRKDGIVREGNVLKVDLSLIHIYGADGTCDLGSSTGNVTVVGQEGRRAQQAHADVYKRQAQRRWRGC